MVTWWRLVNNGDGKQTQQRLLDVADDGGQHENLTISVLHFTPTIGDHGQVLMCRANHSLLSGPLLEDYWTLDVYCKSILSILSFNTLPVLSNTYISNYLSPCRSCDNRRATTDIARRVECAGHEQVSACRIKHFVRVQSGSEPARRSRRLAL